jgi:hypothetical protein
MVTEWMEAIATPVELWLEHHPPIAWALHHPLISIGLFAIVLLLIWSLFQAFVEILQELWMHLLKVPLNLGRWMLRGIIRTMIYPTLRAGSRIVGRKQPQPATTSNSFSTLFSTSPEQSISADTHVSLKAPIHTNTPSSPPIDPGCFSSNASQESETIVQLLYRLEQLTHEQNQILHQLALLAENQHRSPTP